MLSPALSQLLERARTRFGLEVEILDAGLKSLYPEGPTDLSRIIHDSSTVRRSLLEALGTGRPQELEGDGHRYRLYPLGQRPRRHGATGLLAVRREVAQDAEPWSELARAVVEADLASGDVLSDERERSRRYLGVLRFLEFLGQASSERAVTEALVQAAAIWYDVDARIYRRSLDGDFFLHTWLPGAQADVTSEQLSASLVEAGVPFRRVSSPTEIGHAGTAHDASIVVLGDSGTVDWVMLLIGATPADGEPILRAIARAAALQLTAIEVQQVERARTAFEALAAQPASAPELVALKVIQHLLELTHGAAGALTLYRQGDARRIAAIGTVPAGAGSLPSRSLFARDRLVCVLPIGSDATAVLEMWTGGGVQFTAEGAAITRVGAAVLRTWLAGTLMSLEDAATLLDRATASPEFARRIEEELERAKRFGLDLSLILVEVGAPASTVLSVQDAIRRELRGSDLLGTMGTRQLAALLTHTDLVGLDNVVRRLRERLVAAAAQFNVTELRLGRAAFSSDCRTADALLTEAVMTSEPVIVH